MHLCQSVIAGYGKPERYLSLVCEFVDYCVTRYGEDVTNKWQFEISKDDPLFLHGGVSFFRLYESVDRSIRVKIQGARVGGGAIFVYDDLSILKGFLSGWKARKLLYDCFQLLQNGYDVLSASERRHQCRGSRACLKMTLWKYRLFCRI